jgi:hypothetical protein
LQAVNAFREATDQHPNLASNTLRDTFGLARRRETSLEESSPQAQRRLQYFAHAGEIISFSRCRQARNNRDLGLAWGLLTPIWLGPLHFAEKGELPGFTLALAG